MLKQIFVAPGLDETPAIHLDDPLEKPPPPRPDPRILHHRWEGRLSVKSPRNPRPEVSHIRGM